VHLHRGDSAEFFHHLTSQVSSAMNFVYLDVLWHQYLSTNNARPFVARLRRLDCGKQGDALEQQPL
jgi:hypothetical protein